MIEIWYGDLFCGIISEDKWSYYYEIGGYTFVWCEGYGP